MKQWYECPKCKTNNSLLALKVERSGPHLKLSCSECGSYIKMANAEERKTIERHEQDISRKIVLNSLYGAFHNSDAPIKSRNKASDYLVPKCNEYYKLPEPDSEECFKIIEV